MNILKKIYVFDKNQALKDILDTYNTKWYVFVNYIYFANLVWNWVLNWVESEYTKSLNFWDFLLPDGIALKMYLKRWYKKDIFNLNWTDFSEFFLQNIDKDKVALYMYWWKKEVVKKASEYVKDKFDLDIKAFLDWYSTFDFDLFRWEKWKINILFVWLWTPLQEEFVFKNRSFFVNNNFIVFTQWGTFDFWAKTEKRAPKIFQKLKLEWLFRFVTNPKKNYKKVINSLKIFFYLIKKN